MATHATPAAPSTTAPAVEYVDPYPGRDGSERIWHECGRCNGRGSVSWGIPVDGAVGNRIVPKVCFECGGTGSTSHLVSSARATARRRVREANAAAARATAYIAEQAAAEAELDAKRAEFTADHTEVVDWLEANCGRSQFADSVREDLQANGSLTENQIAAVRRILEREATKVAVLEGRITVTGEILSRRYVDNPTGYGAGSIKVRIRDERGFTVYGTLPAPIDEAQVGDQVTFTATVTASDDDPTFGFYKRPTKPAVA